MKGKDKIQQNATKFLKNGSYIHVPTENDQFLSLCEQLHRQKKYKRYLVQLKSEILFFTAGEQGCRQVELGNQSGGCP